MIGSSAPSIAHWCFGVSSAGSCAYDPGNPTLYFTLGDAVAALAFTLAVQQLLRPIHIFRMRARWLSPLRLYLVIFAGALAAVMAAVSPFISGSTNDVWWLYPFNWELLATALFVLAYAALVLSVLIPVQARDWSVQTFARAAAEFLSAATDEDRSAFVADLNASLPSLLRQARRIERGKPTDALSEKEIQRAHMAWSVLRVFADPGLCSALVRRTPWATARMIIRLDELKLHAIAGEHFIQQLAYQAVTLDDSLLERERDYYGFGEAPLLSQALFTRATIIRTWNPLEKFHFSSSLKTSPSLLLRFNHAAKLCMEALAQADDVRGMFAIKEFYKSQIQGAAWAGQSGTLDREILYPLSVALINAVDCANVYVKRLDIQDAAMLYLARSAKYPRFDYLDLAASIVADGLINMAMDYTDFDGNFWHSAHEAVMRVFPSIGAQPDGLAPLQQRVAVKLIEKVRENLQGYYPAIVKVLLSTIGPYEHRAAQPNRTAFNIFKDAFYAELKSGLPALAKAKPDKLADYLPSNVLYNPRTQVLTHRYRFGEESKTSLRTLQIPSVDLFDPSNRRQNTENPTNKFG